MGRKSKRYTEEFKCDVLEMAALDDVSAAQMNFVLDRLVRYWPFPTAGFMPG